LIQIFGNGTSYLFDPFSEIDFKPVFEILENPSILKVMHSPAEDLQLLHKLNCFPVSIFDTERSARLLNYGAFSLSNLLMGILNVAIDKTQQKESSTKQKTYSGTRKKT
jgi:ribonuclease D